MMLCDCYIDEMTYGGTRGKCMGTREYDPCDCQGDKSKCDFFERVRKSVEMDNGERFNIITSKGIKLNDKMKSIIKRYHGGVKDEMPYIMLESASDITKLMDEVNCDIIMWKAAGEYNIEICDGWEDIE